jgi:hypothetical protein
MTTFYSEPGVINAVDPLFPVGSSFTGLQANDMSAATTNTMCLRYLIGLAQASMAGCPMSPSFGTTILIPGHSEVVGRAGPGGTDEGSTYYFQKPYPDPETACIPITCNWPIRFLGTGSTVLSLLADEPDETSFSDFFQVSTSGPGTGDHTGGMTFEDLYFSYPHIDGESTSAAIHVTELGAENIRIVRCNFVDCPVGAEALPFLNALAKVEAKNKARLRETEGPEDTKQFSIRLEERREIAVLDQSTRNRPLPGRALGLSRSGREVAQSRKYSQRF